MPARPKKERNFMDFNEAAGYLGITPKTLRIWVNDGRIWPTRLGPHTIVILYTELDRFIEQNTQRPKAA